MNVSKYTAFFHDGSIKDIKQDKNTIKLIMSSAEINKDDIENDITLSRNNRIQGILHIEGARSIKENGRKIIGIIRMKYNDAKIFDFEINKNEVELKIIWSTFPKKPLKEDFSTLQILAERIWWENIPDLVD